MAIKYMKGDMFAAKVDAIVNTVNCVGVMGKGVALEFKRRWPKNFAVYKKACDTKQLIPGKMLIVENGDMFSKNEPRYLVNFPTKMHWRGKSKIEYIEDGLNDLVAQVGSLNIKSMALPPLGCGNGGLEWQDVKALIEEKLSGINDVSVLVFSPSEITDEPEYLAGQYKFTLERAVMIKTLGEFEKFFGGYLTRISAQKVAYFLQALGFEYGLLFSKHKHGPYSEKLTKAFIGMEERGFLTGYKRGTAEIRVTSGAFAEAEEFLSARASSDHFAKIERLSHLIEGYESPFGMELLASVHYIVESDAKKSADEVIEAVQSWNDHKNNEFTEQSIQAAYNRLKEDQFIH